MGASIEGLTIFALLFYAVVFVFPCWRIFSRAGLPAPLALLAILPIVNIILLWVFAFIDWPALKKTGSDNV